MKHRTAKRAWIVIAGLSALVALPAAAMVTIVYTVWLGVRPPQPPVPVFSDADFAAARPLNDAGLAASIEAATGGQFHVGGPVTVATGPIAREGVMLSAPVSYAVTATVDADERMGPYSVAKGEVFYQETFYGYVKQQLSTLTVWCGRVTIHGLIASTDLLCMTPRKTGDVALFFGNEAGIVNMASDWYPNAIDMNEKLAESEHYPMPHLTPQPNPAPDMRLELVVGGGRKAMSARWQLRKSGHNLSAWLYLGEGGDWPPNWIETSGSHYVFPLGDQWLGFDYNPQTKVITPLGSVGRTTKPADNR